MCVCVHLFVPIIIIIVSCSLCTLHRGCVYILCMRECVYNTYNVFTGHHQSSVPLPGSRPIPTLVSIGTHPRLFSYGHMLLHTHHYYVECACVMGWTSFHVLMGISVCSLTLDSNKTADVA